MQGEMFFPEIEVQSNEKVEAQATWIAKWLQIEFDLMEKNDSKYVFAKDCEIRELQMKINEKKKSIVKRFWMTFLNLLAYWLNKN